jgi:hypothetical protein
MRLQFLDERLPARFWDKVIPEPMSGCWLWGAAANSAGYGMASVGGKWGLAHRHAFMALHGGITPGLELDHLCRTPLCCNPAHLEAVTHRENMLRGNTPSARHAHKTHCDHGHEFTPENTYRGPRGRNCRACRRRYEAGRPEAQRIKAREYKRAWKRRQRANRTAL